MAGERMPRKEADKLTVGNDREPREVQDVVAPRPSSRIVPLAGTMLLLDPVARKRTRGKPQVWEVTRSRHW